MFIGLQAASMDVGIVAVHTAGQFGTLAFVFDDAADDDGVL